MKAGSTRSLVKLCGSVNPHVKIVELIDDLNNRPLEQGAGEAHLRLENVEYTIEPSTANAEKLHKGHRPM